LIQSIAIFSIDTIVLLLLLYRTCQTWKSGIDHSLKIAPAVVALTSMGMSAWLVLMINNLTIGDCRFSLIILTLVYLISKIATFSFMLRKATIVQHTASVKKPVFAMVYGMIVAYIGLVIYTALSLTATNSNDEYLCRWEVPGMVVGSAILMDLLISISTFLIFLKPLVAIVQFENATRSTSHHSHNSHSHNLKVVITRNFLAVMALLASTLVLLSFFMRYQSNDDQRDLKNLFAALLMLDPVVALLSMIYCTNLLSRATEPSHHDSGKNTSNLKNSSEKKNGSKTEPAVGPLIPAELSSVAMPQVVTQVVEKV